MQTSCGERRSRVRFSVELSGTVVSPLGTSKKGRVSVRVREVSFNSLLLELPESISPGEDICLEVSFRGEGKEENVVEMEGTVARCAKVEGEGASFLAGIRLKAIPLGLKEGLVQVLPRRTENLFYFTKGLEPGHY